MEVIEDDMGTSVPPRVLPHGVPEDAEPITEEQIERLPDYVQYLIQEYMKIEREPQTTPEQLNQIRAAYFASAAAAEAKPGDSASISNSTECESSCDGGKMSDE